MTKEEQLTSTYGIFGDFYMEFLEDEEELTPKQRRQQKKEAVEKLWKKLEEMYK